MKASDVFLAVESYRLLAKQIDQPLHLGITEAGGARSGAVKSAIGLGLLLSEGIGDTLRVSLAADPLDELKVGVDILQSRRIRSRGINFIACPTCSRQEFEFDVIGTVNALEQRLEDIITPMDVSIIGYPGNIGNDERIRMVVDGARDKYIPFRIGVNAGSLEKDLQEKYGEPTPQALLESAMRHVDHLDRLNFDQFKVSVKASDVFLAVESYRLLAKQIDQPLHLGITEAGGARSGAVKSAIGLGLLLSEGIGDTLRVPLAADPVEELKVGFDILTSLRIRSRGINFIACPTCSRQEFDVIGTVNALEQRLEDIITPMDVSFIGCVVNGPGEALVSTLGVTGGNKKSGLYEDGVRKDRLDNNDMIDPVWTTTI